NVDWLRLRVRYGVSFNRPKGGELVMSLLATIYYAWVDTANEPITARVSGRKIPFPSFLYTVTPSLGGRTVLTAYKAGIAYCWIVQNILELLAWPGYIHAEIYEGDNGLAGTLEIENSPLTAGSRQEAEQLRQILHANETYNSAAQSSHSLVSQGPAFVGSRILEKRWFTCIFRTLLYIVAKATSARVTDVLSPPPGPDPVVYHLDCVPGLSNKDQMDIHIFPRAGQSEYPLTWDALAKTLLIFGTRIAQDEDGWESAQLVVADD
ncbi:MAG: hypothetical protein Q9196_007252, partial [Gyalolechia fulgens]